MRDPNRIPIVLKAVFDAWQSRPDQRLGQLLLNALSATPIFNSVDLFYLEDEYLVEGLKQLELQKLAEIKAQETGQ